MLCLKKQLVSVWKLWECQWVRIYSTPPELIFSQPYNLEIFTSVWFICVSTGDWERPDNERQVTALRTELNRTELPVLIYVRNESVSTEKHLRWKIWTLALVCRLSWETECCNTKLPCMCVTVICAPILQSNIIFNNIYQRTYQGWGC